MDIDKELLKILDIKPSLQELPEGGYTITDHKKEQVEKIKALFALREVSGSLRKKKEETIEELENKLIRVISNYSEYRDKDNWRYIIEDLKDRIEEKSMQ